MLQRETRWPQIGILLLMYEIFATIGLGRIPPATLASIGIQVGIFLKVLAPYLGVWTLWPTSVVCLNANVIMEQDQFYRIFTAPIFHNSDLHLYYNMVSFAWKGIRLEKRFGSFGFLMLLVLLTGLTGVIYAGLCIAVAEHFKDSSFINQCAVGFSGVLFALKVLANEGDGDFGLFSVPRQMAIWAELIIIQILVPNASFIGHLSGIIAGITVSQIIPTLFYITIQTPTRLLTNSPMTIFVTGLLAAFYKEWLNRPWRTKKFWSSGTPLVCLSSHQIFAKGEYFRLLSGPLEHVGDAHFAICLASIALKLYQLEQKHSVSKVMAMTLASILITSFTFVLAQTFTGVHECVQGLSGPNFALKVLLFFSGTTNFPFFLFEFIELLILIEKRTLLYHISGIIAGLVIWITFGKPDPYPGEGYRLGSTVRNPPSTRSWGYSHYTDAQFRRVVEIQPDDRDSR